MTNRGGSQRSSRRGESRKWALGLERTRWSQEMGRDMVGGSETEEMQEGSDDHDRSAPR